MSQSRELADSAQGATMHALPPWALGWVMLRKMDHPTPGSPSANVQLYVPVTIGRTANEARLELAYGDRNDDVAKLRALALLSPLPVGGEADESGFWTPIRATRTAV